MPLPNESMADELAYVRSLAEEGRNAPLVGGVIYVIWGGLIGTAALIQFAGNMGMRLLPAPLEWAPWFAAFIAGWGFSYFFGWRNGGKPGAFLQTDGSVTLRSDWSRHEAQIEATGTLVKAMGDGQPATPTAGVNGSLRLDLIDGFSATLRGNYDYSTEALSSTSLVSGVAERPAVHAFGGSAELARTGGYFDFSLRGSADRTAYEAAVLDSGGTFSQNDRNNTLYQLTARTAFGPTPSIKPLDNTEQQIFPSEESA